MKFIVSVVLVFPLFAFPPLAYAQSFDFGDLPDPGYPTLLNSTSSGFGMVGPFHVDTTHEWIGTAPTSTTTGEPDAKLVDLDEDDGSITIWNVEIDGSFANLGRVAVPVTTDTDTTCRYLNVAADLNADGIFQTFDSGGQPQYEWLICNCPIVFTDDTKVILGYFTLQSPLVTVSARRATLTTYPIDPGLFGPMGWDGGGPAIGFARGETEDFYNAMTVPTHIWQPDGTGADAPELTDPPFPPGTPPPPRQPVTDHPEDVPGIPGHRGKKPQPPATPGGGIPPNNPIAPEPPRNAPFSVVGEAGHLRNMPDIKQGPAECIPTAAANSIRYLMNNAGLDSDYMIQEGLTSEELNRRLQEKLKEAMKTNNPEPGTGYRYTETEEGDFRRGKRTADLPPSIAGRVTTTVCPNPSFDQIRALLNKGFNVEIMLRKYGADGQPIDPAHMVTVSGYVLHNNGTMELKIHDPGDKEPGENSGDTVDPPRENSIIVTNATGSTGQGGLHVLGYPCKPGEHIVIEGGFAEELADAKPLGTFIDHELPPEVPYGEGFTITAMTPGKADFDGYFFQWYKDGMPIDFENNQTYEVLNATPADTGEYTVWVYDYDGGHEMTQEVVVTVETPLMPIANTVITVILAGFLALIATRMIRQTL